MIYTTFEQIEYGFVLLEINKKHLDINRFRKYKIERFGLNRPLQWKIQNPGQRVSNCEAHQSESIANVFSSFNIRYLFLYL